MKLLIPESQLEVIINHIKKTNSPKKEVLEEGWKDIVLGTAMLMGIGLSGANAQTAKNALDTADIIQKIEKTLEGPEIEKVAATLEKAGLKDAMTKIQNNAETVKQNLEDAGKKKGLKLDVQIYNTSSKSSVKTKVGQGYAVSDVKVTRDTVWTPKNVIQVANSVELNLDGNSFKPGMFSLDDSVSAELKETIESILMMGGKITSIHIESSTDTEPIGYDTKKALQAANYDATNKALAEARKDGVYRYLNSIGVDESKVSFELKPEQGPDVYSKTMTPQERDSARSETAQYRYVKVIINSVVEPKPQGEELAYEVIERVKYELTKTSVYKGGKIKLHKKGNNKTKKYKCSKVKVDGIITDCEVFN